MTPSVWAHWIPTAIMLPTRMKQIVPQASDFIRWEVMPLRSYMRPQLTRYRTHPEPLLNMGLQDSFLVNFLRLGPVGQVQPQPTVGPNGLARLLRRRSSPE